MAFGSMNSGGEDAPMADINVTPLVDVMLVLMIVFMITMPVLTHSIPLELPTASEKAAKKTEKPDRKNVVSLSIDASGGYVLGADSTAKLTLEQLETGLKQAQAENPDVIIAINADKSVEYDFVAKALETVKEAGIPKVGFQTEVKRAAQ